MALTLRSTKGSALTHTEQDENYSGLASGTNWAATIAATSNITLTGTLSVSSTLAVTGISTFSSALRAADGSSTAPSYSFTSSPNLGWYNVGGAASQTIGLAIPSNNKALLLGSTIGGNIGLALQSGGQIVWATGADPGGTLGLVLTNGGANILELRNTTSAQTFRVYNTYTDASNYERLSFSFSSNNSVIRQEAAGTGSTARSLSIRCDTGGNLNFGIGGVDYWRITNGGAHLFALTDNTYDIGQSGATRPRTGYFGTSVFTPIVDSGAASSISFKTNSGTQQFVVSHTPSSVTAIQVSGSGTGTAPFVLGTGETNTGLRLACTGAGTITLETGAGTRTQVQILDTASATRSITLTGSNGGNPTISTSAGNLAITPNVTMAATLAVHGATAIPAGGTAGVGYIFSSATNFGIFFGSGAPTLSAAQGSLYLRSDGTTTNNRAYINTTGSTTWTALTTVA